MAELLGRKLLIKGRAGYQALRVPVATIWPLAISKITSASIMVDNR